MHLALLGWNPVLLVYKAQTPAYLITFLWRWGNLRNVASNCQPTKPDSVQRPIGELLGLCGARELLMIFFVGAILSCALGLGVALMGLKSATLGIEPEALHADGAFGAIFWAPDALAVSWFLPAVAG